jgi:hypothetical protein
VIREWEQWARLGTTPPTGGLLPPDGVPPPGEVAATAAELADVAFLEAAADGAAEAAELEDIPERLTRLAVGGR